MGIYKPAQMLGIYGGVTGLIYYETDGFRQDAPLLYATPLIILAVLTFRLTMKSSTKYLTAFSFILSGAALYVLDRRVLNSTTSLMTMSHLLYLLSFIKCMQYLWNGLAIFLTLYVGALLYHCFADLIYSIPLLVFALSVHVFVIFVAAVVAGSVWHHGSKLTSAQQADLLRFVGLMTCLICTSILLLNRFGHRLQEPHHYSIKLLCYLSQPLLFFANERAF